MLSPAMDPLEPCSATEAAPLAAMDCADPETVLHLWMECGPIWVRTRSQAPSLALVFAGLLSGPRPLRPACWDAVVLQPLPGVAPVAELALGHGTDWFAWEALMAATRVAASPIAETHAAPGAWQCQMRLQRIAADRLWWRPCGLSCGQAWGDQNGQTTGTTSKVVTRTSRLSGPPTFTKSLKR